MSKSFKIRIATRDDASSIADFNVFFAKTNENKQLSLPVTAQGVRRVFNTFYNGFYIVAEKEGKIIGVSMVTREWSDWNNGSFYCIQDIFVLDEDKDSQIHDALFKKVKSMATEHEEVCGVRLYVHKDDKAGQKHLESLDLEKREYRIYDCMITKEKKKP